MRICLVSESSLFSRTLREFLSDLGHEVEAVQTIYALPERLERGPLDLALLEVSSLNEEGIHLMHQLRQRHPDLLVILSGEHLPVSAEEAHSLGIYRYLRKPLHLDELEFALRSLSKNCSRCRFISPIEKGAANAS